MKKTVKAPIAFLLTLVMLMTSFLVFGVTGSAAAAEHAIFLNESNSSRSGVAKVSTGDALDLRVGANTSVAVNARLDGLTESAGAGKTDRYAMSFSITPEQDKLPKFGIRFRESGSAYRSFVEFAEDGTVTVFDKNTIATLKKGIATEIYLDITAKWASKSGTNNGTMTVSAYVDGVYVGTYSASMKLASVGSGKYVQLNGAVTSYDVTENNGVYFEDKALGAAAGAGYYSTVLLEDVRFYKESARENFVYPGASMRVDATAETSGLRFTYGIDKTWFNSLEGAKVGALIIPTDKLANGFSAEALAELELNKDYLELSDIGFSSTASEADENTYVYYASLINLKAKNYARAFTGVGFVELADGTRIYTGSQSRSIYDVASGYTKSGDVTEAHKPLITEYMGKVVSLSTVDGVVTMPEIANYTSPYALETTANGFALSGTVDNITAIILDGVVYTGGWKIADGKLSVSLSAE